MQQTQLTTARTASTPPTRDRVPDFRLRQWVRVLSVFVLFAGLTGCSIEDFIPDSAKSPGGQTTPDDPPVNAEPPADPTAGYPPTHPSVIEPKTPPIEGNFDAEPEIEWIDPTEVDAPGGTVITIHGDNFQSGCAVFIGDVEIDDVFWIDEQWINITTPKLNSGRFDVTVLNPDGGEGTLEDALLVMADLEVHGIEPNIGHPAGGTPVTITGSGFEPGVRVLIGDRLASAVEIIDGDTLTAIAPPGPTGKAHVRVLLEGQSIGLLSNGFEFAGTPEITSTWPPHGPTIGGTLLEVSGRYFTGDLRARLGGKDATIVSVESDGQLLVIETPGGAVGPVTLTLENAQGTASFDYAFTYLAPTNGALTLATVTPPRGSVAGGDLVRLIVQGLAPSLETTVTIGGTAASVQSAGVYPGVVEVLTPPGTLGLADVVLAQGDQSATLLDGFEYRADLAVSSVSPATAGADGGDFLVLSGAGFEGHEDVTVSMGNVPVTDFDVQSDGQIVIETPPCSPGETALTITVGDQTVSLNDAVTCELDGVHLFAIDPPAVSQAGGALIKVIGHNLPTSSSLRFGEDWGEDITWTSPQTVWVRAPRGDAGTVDVRLNWPGMDGPRVIQSGLDYFDPANKNAGTWGPAIDRSVNVTLYSGSSGDPIENGFAVLGADPATPHRCYTDDRGQCTISWRDVQGPQTVTGVADGYSAYTIAGTNGSNVTMFIRPQSSSPSSGPPGGGGGGGGPSVNINSLIGTVSGTVSGIGKYVVPPPPNCNIAGSPDGLQCTPCDAATPCLGGLTCTPLSDLGSWCVKSCTSNAECGVGFACSDIGYGAQCVPHGGDIQVRCGISRRSFFGSDPNPGPGSIVDLTTNTFSMDSRLGEVTVYCMGGYLQPQTGVFIPTIMGMKQTVIVHLFEETPDVDIELNIPLTRTLRARMFDLPDHPNGITNPGYISALDLGAQGWLPFAQTPTWTDGELLYFAGYPESLEPFGIDASYTFYMYTQAMVSGSRPASYYLIHKLDTVDGDPVLQRAAASEEAAAGQWVDAGTGMAGDLSAVWGAASDDVFGVGPGGRIVHAGPLGWGIQPAVTDLDLHDVWGDAPNNVFAVGEKGVILRFNAVNWTVEPSSVDWDIRSVHGGWAVGDGGILQRVDGGGWFQHEVLHSKGLRGVHRVHANLVVAVGESGKVLTWSNGKWNTALIDGVDDHLNAVWSDGSVIVAVGENGLVLVRALGGTWKVLDGGFRDLYSITGDSDGSVWIGGSVGTVLRLDVATGVLTDETNPDHTRIDLHGMWFHEGAVTAVGHTSMPIGPWMDFPEPVSPIAYEVMDQGRLAWDFNEPGPVPTYNQMYLSTSDGFYLWTIMAAGPVSDIDLPPLEDMIGYTPFGAGQKYFNFTRSLTPTFDIDGYKFNQTSLWRRTTWSTAFGVFY